MSTARTWTHDSPPLWDRSVDFISVGSGGGGLVAAIAAADRGLDSLVLEKQSVLGGSTAMSGGMIWMPDNPLMASCGIRDSFQDGMTYLDALIGDVGPASSPARREAFISGGSDMISFLQSKGVDLVRCDGFADYYPRLPGFSTRGRGIESAPWDGRKLGPWRDKINPGMARRLGLAIKSNELRHVPKMSRSMSSLATMLRINLRTRLALLRGKDLFTTGMALIGQLTRLALDSNVTILLNSPVDELIRDEKGRVVGVRVAREGESPLYIEARRGVLLAAGGFERNSEMRRSFSRQPNDGSWTKANLGNTGDLIEAAVAIGADVALMDGAIWWIAPRAELAASTLTWARQMPHTIMVNRAGKRFCDEGATAMEVGVAMYDNDAVPAWLVFDDTYRKRYPIISPHLESSKRVASVLDKLRPGRLPEEWIEKGLVLKASSLAELAGKMGLDPQVFTETVERFNRHAVDGKDPEFRRGEGVYYEVMGDPKDPVSAAVGPVSDGPFYAVEQFPTDLGTYGGLLCDEESRVLDAEGKVIPGLYATGNMTASVTGLSYPGSGTSIAASMTFGWRAALHAA